MFDKVVDQAVARGTWIEYYEEKAPAPGESEPIRSYRGFEFCIRRIPPGKRMELERRYRGGTRKVKLFRSGDSEITRDLEKELAVGIELAVFALIDSRPKSQKRGCELRLVDEGAAALFRGFLKDQALKAGDVVTLDGRWTDEIRRDFLSEWTDVAAWIVARADELDSDAAEDEAGKERTSSTTRSSD